MKHPWVRNFPYGGSGTARGKINIVNPIKDYLIYYAHGGILSITNSDVFSTILRLSEKNSHKPKKVFVL